MSTENSSHGTARKGVIPVRDGTSELNARFQILAHQWSAETSFLSSISAKVQHPAYTAIIEMGESVLPLILIELRDRPAHWFTALNKISGQSPIEPSDKADPKKARGAWLAWGIEKGWLDECRNT